MRVVICGGGVIGASIAYFLSRRGVAAIVVERTGVACAASGKSGGFLALDWCDGNAMGPLARRSYALHEALAAESNVDWGYRALDTLGVVARARGGVDRYRRHAGPAWLGPDAAVHGQLGTTATTAQVHPAAFTRAMVDGAVMGGAQLRAGRVTGVALTPDGTRATGVEVDGEIVAADAVVIAMGPWSVLACQWLPLPAIHGLKGHSIVVRPDPPATPHALFVEYEAADGEVDAPEVVPRPDGTTYVSGLSSEAAMPVDPADVAPEAGAEDALRAMAARVAPALGQAEILATQACYRPIAADALPLLGPVPGVAGAYVATGHNCWGILNAPASGEAMAELIADGAATTLDLAAFDPARLAPLRAHEAAALTA